MSNQGPGRGQPSDGTSASAMLPARTRSQSPTHASNLLRGFSETQLQVPTLGRFDAGGNLGDCVASSVQVLVGLVALDVAIDVGSMLARWHRMSSASGWKARPCLQTRNPTSANKKLRATKMKSRWRQTGQFCSSGFTHFGTRCIDCATDRWRLSQCIRGRAGFARLRRRETPCRPPLHHA